MKTTDSTNIIKSACIYKVPSLKLKICFCIACIIFLKPCSELKSSGNGIISPWSILMAENLMNNPSIANGPNLQYYVFVTAMKGLRELWEATEDSVYYEYIADIVDNSLSFYEGLGSELYYVMDFISWPYRAGYMITMNRAHNRNTGECQPFADMPGTGEHYPG